MKLTLDKDERPILLTKLGLSAKATNAEITAAVTERLTGGTASPPPPQPIGSRQADGHDLIAAAVRDERIPASRADHYAQRFAQDPEGTAKVLAKLQPGSAHYANETVPAAATAESYPAHWLPEAHRGERVTQASD